MITLFVFFYFVIIVILLECKVFRKQFFYLEKIVVRIVYTLQVPLYEILSGILLLLFLFIN